MGELYNKRVCQAVAAEMDLELSALSASLKPDTVLQSLVDLTSGATLLKAGRSGRPHFRRFRLTSDLTRLIWESSKKTDAAVLISQISEIKLGQKTQNFKRNPLPQFESRSFSLIYGGGRSLDIVCKDKKEFQTWTTGLMALKEGFSDHQSVEQFMSQVDRKAQVKDDRLRVTVGTIRSKVSHKENACDLYTWGSGLRGMLGHKDEDDERVPRVVESLLGRDIVMAACGVAHTMALGVTGEVYSWGSGFYGRLGHGNLRDRFSPLMIGAPLRGQAVTYIACHEFHSAAVCDNGELFTWGRAGPYLGYTVEGGNKQMRPRRVSELENHRVSQVACGCSHTLVCTEGNQVFSFGSNEYGELGLGHEEPTTLPSLVSFKDDPAIYRIACGRNHSAAVDVEGGLYMWGWGGRGQLGQGEVFKTPQNSPLLVEGFNEQPVTDISCGDGHSCCLTGSGIPYCWGDNSAGQLGVPLSTQEICRPRAVLIPTGNHITQVACGANFTVALTSTGSVFTWGLGVSGQLAHGENKSRSQPVEVEALAGKQCRLAVCGKDHMACTVIHGWVPDEEAAACMACKKNFTTIRRRHHCRQCGGLYCGTCSSKRFPLLDRGFSDPVRVCDKCHHELSSELHN